MNTTSIVPDKLKEFDYYKNKLPLYLQNSYGFVEHFRIWYDMYVGDDYNNGFVPCMDLALNLLNIFDDDYLEFIANLPDSGVDADNPYGTRCDVLDKIANLFGVKRNFSCTYVDEDLGSVTEELSLNNEELLILVRGQIIKNYCEGTYSQITQYYDSTGLKICLVTTSNENAEATLYLISTEEDSISDNIKKMFLSGMFRIESMGIRYFEIASDLEGFLRWESGIGNEEWDVGVWSR